MLILGISAFYHDSGAAIINNGNIIAAAQEERFSREKHDSSFPKNSIKFCLRKANSNLKDVKFVVFYDKPILKFERLLQTHICSSPLGFNFFKKSMPLWLKEKLFQKKILLDSLRNLGLNLVSSQLLFSEHHMSHAASAFFPSPFKESLILTMDGVGEWATTTISKGENNKISILKEINFPHSIGMLYSAFTYYLGFKVNSGEYKVMGLAPYGQPKFKEIILKKLIEVKDDGSFQLNMDYFDYCKNLKMINKKFENLFGQTRRLDDSQPLSQFHKDVAASIQKVIEIVILKICRYISKEFNRPNLCLAGGVALNCVANGLIHNSKLFKNIWIQPASNDSGGAIGAALLGFYKHQEGKRVIKKSDSMKNSYLGPQFKTSKVQDFLKKNGIVFKKYSHKDLISKTVEALAKKRAVGWMQGRMEFGPRALGNRSILGDPRSKDMQKILNLKIKYRESFRPFAPSILLDQVKDWFEGDMVSPYMLLVTKVKKKFRQKIPSVTHVDHSARIHTVSKETNLLFYNLIKEFFIKTGCPMLINTSFNVRGEPIVCTPYDAYNCFMGTNLDNLIIDNFFLIKENQTKLKNSNYIYSENKYDD